MHFFCLLSGSGLARTDCPNGFVSEDNVSKLFGGEVEERAGELCFNHFVLLAAFALFEHFADAENHLQAVSEGEVDFFFENFSRFAIVSAAFAVAEDYVACARALHHFGRNFTGVSAACLVCAVLCAEADNALVDNAGHGGEVDKRSADHDVAVGLVGFEDVVQLGCEGDAFLQVLVHFPVTCYDFFSHNFFNG